MEMTFTVKDLNEAVDNDKVTASYTHWKSGEVETEVIGWADFDEHSKVEFEDIGTAEIVETAGGEGEGDSAHIIFKIRGRHFMKTGYYASFDGFYWDDGRLFEVEPYEKTVTAWREVK